jgi:hypothetical protein
MRYNIRFRTGLLLCIHAQSLVLFVAFLCVASKDLNSTAEPPTTPLVNTTSATTTPTTTEVRTTTIAQSLDDLNETTIPIGEFDLEHASSKH